MAAGSSEHPVAVYGAIVANALIAVVKFIAAFLTGSSAMLSEGIHSVVDTGNQLLLLFGIHQAKKPADEQHPFGHGKEIYFWGLIVAMILFGIGGGMSVYEGIHHIQHPGELSDPTWSYVVLAVALAIESVSTVIAVKEMLRRKEKDLGIWQAMRSSKDPAIYVVVAENAAAILGIIIAGAGIWISHLMSNTIWDGIASIAIGVVLAAVAIFLSYESKGLLVGESTDAKTLRQVEELAKEDPSVEGVKPPLTMHLGPNNVFMAIAIQFRPHLTAAEIVAAVDRLQKKIQENCPRINRIFIEAESLKDNQTDANPSQES